MAIFIQRGEDKAVQVVLVDSEGDNISISDIEDIVEIGAKIVVGSTPGAEFELYPETGEGTLTLVEPLPSNTVRVAITRAMSEQFPQGPAWLVGRVLFVDDEFPEGRAVAFNIPLGQVGRGVTGAFSTPD